jgi:two-component system sensor histidine kinase KdpD
VESGLPPAWADELLLEEVVRNLLENATHYAAPEAPIEVRARLDQGSILVDVTDHGAGVPADEQALIFESFHRVGDEDTTVGGYGLGLYFADRLLRAMGGRIGVRSPVHADPSAPGSTFTIGLPVAVDSSSTLEDGGEDG